MNINDLQKVADLKAKLELAIKAHKVAMSLTTPKAGRFGLDDRAYITLGGDMYGNGKVHEFDIKILNSPEMVAICRKLQSDAWGKVVGLRYQLRSLGVTLEGDDK